ncbi:MAG: hypothetical protein AAGU76_02775 [Sedimentibacter sp.]|uniref:hypothetical protein n=1 Tax=Sedimentibacter sp. TaxID=1960295 RepID=UPI003158D8DB
MDEFFDIPRTNKREVLKNTNCNQLLNNIKNLYSFFDNFLTLANCRNFCITRTNKKINSINEITFLNPNIIINSSLRTLYSIYNCCEHANFSDAYCLIRKYRDDLFFYLYIILISNETNIFNGKELSKEENIINKWLGDKLSHLNIDDILTYISKSDITKEAVEKYKFNETFKNISKKLNNYVHGNGKGFYNMHLWSYKDEKIANITCDIIYNLQYITTTFIFILTLISQISIMSDDYIDALDFEGNPVEGTQYYIAPFINEFMKKNKSLLDENCIEYLIEKTGMLFE